MQQKILFVVNSLDFFVSHRLPIAQAMEEKGFEVHIATGSTNKQTFSSVNYVHHVLPITRSSQNPLRELFSLVAFYKLFKKVKPEIVHLITIKPVIYGGIAARLSGVKAVVAAISGLGTVFTGDSGFSYVRRSIIARLYRLALGHKNLVVIFQNPSDMETLLALGSLDQAQARMIRGSGVNLEAYPSFPETGGSPVVAMAARLLKDKGVNEFVEAARLLKRRGVRVSMRLIGSCDPGNPTSLSDDELVQIQQEQVVELLGYQRDIAAQYAAANIVCLPSYREGLPKGLIEAAACGRAVVTTDVPGCRDAIEPNLTGLLVPVKQPEALADAIEKLISSPELRAQMGKAGRALAEREFSIERVIEQHQCIYQELLCDA